MTTLHTTRSVPAEAPLPFAGQAGTLVRPGTRAPLPETRDPLPGTRTAGTRTAGTRGPRRAAGARGRALLAALGLALAAAVLPATVAHAAPQSPDPGNQFANPGGNPQPPQPPEPPDVPDWGPQDLVPPTEIPDPPLPPDPPDVPDWGPDDLAPPTEDPDPPLPPNPPDNGPTSPGSDSISTPQRVDAGFGGTAGGSHQVTGLALIGAALVLTLLVIVIARRHQAEARTPR